MAFVGIGIHYLDLAFLDINEAIHRFTGPCEKHSRRIRYDFAGGAQRLNVRCGQRRALHLTQIVADRFHVLARPFRSMKFASYSIIVVRNQAIRYP